MARVFGPSLRKIPPHLPCSVMTIRGHLCHSLLEPPPHSHPFYSRVLLHQKRTVKKSQAVTPKPKKDSDIVRERIIRRAALEFEDGMYGIL